MLENKLKIYSDRSLVPEGRPYHFILYPFWGLDKNWKASDPSDLSYGTYDNYIAEGDKYIQLVDSPAEADVFVYPRDLGNIDYTKDESFLTFYQEAEALNKKVIVFYVHDSDRNIDLPNAVILRTSFNKSTQKENELAIPGFVLDLTSYQLQEKKSDEKNSKPSISYCGYIDYSTQIDRLKRLPMLIKFKIADLFFARKKYYSNALRGKAVRKFQQSKFVRFNFIYRTIFFGAMQLSKEDQMKMKLEYVQSILDADYALVIRGNGNFSFRLSEVLSAGRIPIFVNTDSVLPYDSIVDWKKYMLWVELEDLNRIDEMVYDYHQQFKEKDIRVFQKEIQQMYESYFSPLGYFKNLSKLVGKYCENIS